MNLGYLRGGGEVVADGEWRNIGPAINIAKRVSMMCDFIEHQAIKEAVNRAVPVSMPREVGALGFDIPALGRAGNGEPLGRS
jgi:hypothetical protein